MDNLALVAISELLDGDKKNISPGQHHVEGIYKIKLNAFIKKGEDTEAAPTTSIPFKTVLALMLEKSGATRENLLNMLETCIKEAMDNGDSIAVKLAERFKELDTSIGRVTARLKKLPKVPKSGATKVVGKLEFVE